MNKNVPRKMLAATFGLVITATAAMAYAGDRVCMAMYDDQNYGGAEVLVENGQTINYLYWFNDHMTSLKTYDNCICSIGWNANYPTDLWFQSDESHANIGTEFAGWNDVASSAQCL